MKIVLYFRKEPSTEGTWSRSEVDFGAHLSWVSRDCCDNDIHNSVAAGQGYDLLSMIVPLNKKLCTQHAKKLEVGKGGATSHIRGQRGKNCRSIIYN